MVRRVASLYSGSITAATPCALPTALATAASSAQLAHAPLCMSAAAPKAPSSWPTSPPRPRPPPGRAAQPPPLRYTHHTTRLHILSHQEPSGVPRLSAVAGTSSSTFRRALASFAPYVSQSTRVHRHSPLITCFGVHAVHSLGSARSASGGAALPLPPTHALPPRPPSEARWRSCGSLRVPSPLRSD